MRYRVLEAIESIILMLRDRAFLLCRFKWIRPIASPVYGFMRKLSDWYWEKML